MRAARNHAADRYVPIDALLEQPKVRVLRALKRFDEASTADLFDALDIQTNAEKQTIWRVLPELLTAGHVARRDGRMYRITQLGLEELATILAKAEVNEDRNRRRSA